MIVQFNTTAIAAANTRFEAANINKFFMYEVTEENFYMASLWACYAGEYDNDVEKTYITIMIVPPEKAITTNAQMREHAVIWGQPIYLHESFNIAGMALPKGTKIYVGANQPIANNPTCDRNVTFTLTGTGM